ncbi:MAG: hypothetical protein ABI561_13880, partial [Bradyrhizobium sp.]
LFVLGYQPEFLETLGSQYAQSPMAAAEIAASVGDVNILSSDRRELLESRLYRDVLQPFGLIEHDLVSGHAARASSAKSEPVS